MARSVSFDGACGEVPATGEQLIRVFGPWDLSEIRVDPFATVELRKLGAQPTLGIDLPLEALGAFPSVGAVVAGAPRSRTFRPLLDPSSHWRATCRLASGSTISLSTSTWKGGLLNVDVPHPTALESTSRHLSIDTSRADRLENLEDLRSGIATGTEFQPGRRGTEPALQPSAAFRPLPWPHAATPPFRQSFGSPVGFVVDFLIGRDSSSLRGFSDTLQRRDKVTSGSKSPTSQVCTRLSRSGTAAMRSSFPEPFRKGLGN